MLKLSLYFLLLLISLVSSDDSKFYFDGFLEKGMSNYELPSSIKLTWFNFLEQGNLLWDIDNKTVRRQKIPICLHMFYSHNNKQFTREIMVQIFCSSHFSFLVFGHFWLRSYENTKILRNLCLHFARQDGTKRKENHETKVTKIPKNQKTKNMG